MKTNSISKRGVTNARRIHLVIALALFPLLASEKTFAQNAPLQTPPNATGTLVQTGTGLTTFTFDITTSTTFQLDLNITTAFQSIGLTYFLQSNDGNGFFQITARDITGSPFSDRTTSDAQAFGGMAGVLNPVNDFDLGAVLSDVNDPLAPGTYFVATLTISILAGIGPGPYHLFLDSRGIVADNDFNDHQLVTNQITIGVIPEPAAGVLAVLGGGLLLALAWRARRVLEHRSSKDADGGTRTHTEFSL